jgi:cytochrome c-type biogenesis protein CcmH/NrfF
MNWRNAWLWGAPALLMLIGLSVGVYVVRERQRHVDVDDPESDESLDP